MPYSLHERFRKLKRLGLVSIGIAGNEDFNLEFGDNNPEFLTANKQGFFAAYDSGENVSFELAIETSRRPGIHVVWLEGNQRTIKVLADRATDKGTAVFVKRIPTSQTLNGGYATKNNDFQSNGVWLISTAKSELQMWEIAIVTVLKGGYSRYHLSLQLVYRADMYCDKDGKIWIPPEQFQGYESWTSLRSFLAETVEPKSLSPDVNYRHDDFTVITPPSSADKAKIVWFSQTRRYGFALLADGRTARLHASQVLGQEFPAFEPCQLVAFKSLETTPRGVDLVGVTET